MVYVIIGMFLMVIVYNLSDIGRLLVEVLEQETENVDMALRFGMPLRPFRMPAFEITVLGTVFFLLPLVFLRTIDVGYLYYVKHTAKGETMGLWSLLEGFNYFLRAVFVWLIYFAAVILGLVFFLVPGIVLFCGFSQVDMLLLDHPRKNVFWFFGESWRLMRKRKWEYLTLRLSFFGWFLLPQIGMLAVGFVGYAARLWYVLYAKFTRVYYYHHITGQGPEVTETEWKRPGMF